MRTLSAVALLALPALVLPADEPAPQKEVAAIARELALPPRPGDDFALDKQSFPAAALRPYAADVPLEEIQKAPPNKYKLRTTVLKAFATVREAWSPPVPPPPRPLPKGAKGKAAPRPVTGFLTALRPPVTEALKAQVREYQVLPAVGIVKLEEALRELEAVAGLRASEPRRWQAHHDYAAAELHARLAFLHEYDLSLGQVLKEELPELGKSQDGWRLVPAAKMHSKKDVQKLAEQARELFEKVAAEHRDTPWAALAKRELARPPGLKWEATGVK